MDYVWPIYWTNFTYYQISVSYLAYTKADNQSQNRQSAKFLHGHCDEGSLEEDF